MGKKKEQLPARQTLACKCTEKIGGAQNENTG